jgi:hypothetical protein
MSESLKAGAVGVASEIAGLNLGDISRKNLRPSAGKIWEMIKSLLADIDLSSMTKEEFLDKVDDLYDSMVAPAIIAINPMIGPVLNAVLNQLVLSLAGRFYDNHSGN